MIFEEHHFEYGDFISRKFGLIFAHADTSTFLKLTGDISTTPVYNKKNSTWYSIGNDYSESRLSFDIDIITDNLKALTREDRRIVEKALFNKTRYEKLYVDLADDCMGETYEFVNGEMKRLYLNCKLINPEKIEDGHGIVVGYKCTVECDSGYLIQDEVEVTHQIVQDPDTAEYIFTVFVDTDTNDYVYPRITIDVGEFPDDVPSSRRSISIRNYSDRDGDELLGAPTKFTDLSGGESIIIDCEKNYVSGDYYTHMQTRKFPRLVDGDNAIHVIGPVSSVSIKWNNRRFL